MGNGVNTKLPLIAAAIGVTLLAAGAGGALYFVKGSPTARYNEALNAYTSGDYASAASKFEKLGDYRDSKTRSAEALTRMHYANGQAAFSSGDYDKAKEEFTAAGTYEEAESLAAESDKASHYAKAKKLAASGDLDKAIEEFNASGYKDYKDKLAELYMTKAEKAAEQGDHDQAIEFAQKAADNKGSDEPVLITYYKLGETAFAKQELVKAASYFVNAEEYKDASERAKSLYYTLGKDALGKNDYENAANFFALAKDYKDTKSISKEAFYVTGKNRYNDKNYAAAAGFFKFAGDYKDAKALYNESYYILGTDALKAGKYTEAAEHFGNCGSYKYAADLVNVCKGEAAAASKDLKNAMAAYNKVSKKAAISGFNIQARKAFISRWYKMDAICHDYSVVYNILKAEKRTSSQIRGYSRTYILSDQAISIKYTVNNDGTFNVTGTVSWGRLTNCPNDRNDLNSEVYTSSFKFSKIKSFPTTIKLSGGAKLVYKNGQFTVTFSKKSGSVKYQSTITYR